MLAMEPRSLWVSFCAHNEHVYILALHLLVCYRRGTGLEQAGFLSGM